jgi:hypothetical protein
MALLDQAQLARHEAFRDRVLIAALNTAVAVGTEASSGDARKDSLRKTLATNVLNDPAGYVNRFSFAAAADPAISFGSTDNAIVTKVSALWNNIAGV